MNTSLDTISSRLDELSSTVNNITVGSQGNSLSFIKEVDSKDPFSTEILDSIQNLIDSQSPEIADAKVQLEKLKNDLEQFTGDAKLTDSDIAELKSVITTDITKCKDRISDVKELINGDLSSTLTSSMSSMQSSLSQAQSILSDVPGTFSEISSTLTEYQSILNDGKANVQITVKYMSDLKDNINSLIQKLDSITASQSFQEIMSAIKENPQMIVDFISSPVQMNTVEVFAISNYGSAMAPFYTVLALWVGALILVALIHVKVKDSDEIPGGEAIPEVLRKIHKLFRDRSGPNYHNSIWRSVLCGNTVQASDSIYTGCDDDQLCVHIPDLLSHRGIWQYR